MQEGYCWHLLCLQGNCKKGPVVLPICKYTELWKWEINCFCHLRNEKLLFTVFEHSVCNMKINELDTLQKWNDKMSKLEFVHDRLTVINIVLMIIVIVISVINYSSITIMTSIRQSMWNCYRHWQLSLTAFKWRIHVNFTYTANMSMSKKESVRNRQWSVMSIWYILFVSQCYKWNVGL